MKKLIIAATALCAIFTVSAQRLDDSYLGIRAGLDIASPTLDGMTNGAGFNVGAVYNIPVYKMVYFEPGLSIYYNTFGIDHTDGSFRTWGFRVPLDFGLRVGLAKDIYLTPFTGPEMNFGLSDDYHLKNVSVGVYGDDGFLRRFDLAWNFGVGLNYDHFYVGVAGALGMLNLNKMDGDAMHMNRVTISLGYNF